MVLNSKNYKSTKEDLLFKLSKYTSINLGFAEQPTYLKNIGDQMVDKLYEDKLELEFFVDENLENYMQVHNWLQRRENPESI